jgi:hypothetical protein
VPLIQITPDFDTCEPVNSALLEAVFLLLFFVLFLLFCQGLHMELGIQKQSFGNIPTAFVTISQASRWHKKKVKIPYMA